MAENNTLARPYAQAVFELAGSNGSLSEWAAALTAAGQVIEVPEIAAMAHSPTVTDQQLLDLLQSVFGDIAEARPLADGNGPGGNFVRLLIENDRLSLLPQIATRFQALKDAAENTVDVTITTAGQIDDAQQSEITRALASRLGREINVTTAIDEDLIGGAVIRAGDFVIDGSIRGQLTKMSAVLSK